MSLKNEVDKQGNVLSRPACQAQFLSYGFLFRSIMSSEPVLDSVPVDQQGSFSSFLKTLASFTGDLSNLTCPSFLLAPISLLEYSWVAFLWSFSARNCDDCACVHYTFIVYWGSICSTWACNDASWSAHQRTGGRKVKNTVKYSMRMLYMPTPQDLYPKVCWLDIMTFLKALST